MTLAVYFRLPDPEPFRNKEETSESICSPIKTELLHKYFKSKHTEKSNSQKTGGTMKFPNDSEEEKTQPKAEEWLNLHTGKNSFSTIRYNGSEPETAAPSKVFSCRYCYRKFYSSQALGGHQNAHKRERGAIRRYPSQGMMGMMNFPFYNSMMIRSLGVQAHSQVYKPGRDKEGNMFARFDADNTMPPMVLHSLPEKTIIWPGSFKLNTQAPEQQPTSPPVLDLNLKL